MNLGAAGPSDGVGAHVPPTPIGPNPAEVDHGTAPRAVSVPGALDPDSSRRHTPTHSGAVGASRGRGVAQGDDMDRRRFLAAGCGSLLAVEAVGCRGTMTGKVMTNDQKDTVGSNAAGAETFKPLIDEALGKLLARQGVHPVGHPAAPPAAKRVCFVGLENKSSEELGDFKAQIVEIIDTRVNTSGAFHQISRRFVEAGLGKCRLRPDELFLPENQRKFLAVMESQGQPFDYLLFATVTSGTTRDNDRTQKDYLLTLELVDVQTGTPDKESASLRKGYRKTHGPR